MDRAAMERLLKILEEAWKTEEFKDFAVENEILHARFVDAVEEMTEKQSNAVYDYVGYIFEVEFKLWAFALEQGYI